MEKLNLVEGECNCGSITFEIDAHISDVFICHCSICSKSSGTGGVAVVIVGNGNFNWTRGRDQLSFWSKPEHDWHNYFCNVCGSSMPGENDGDQMYIPVGTLTSGHENLKVAHHLHVNSKASWEKIGDLGKQHPEGYKAGVSQ
jgi:hypothetical protein